MDDRSPRRDVRAEPEHPASRESAKWGDAFARVEASSLGRFFRRTRSRHREWIALGLAVFLVELVYVFLISAGHFTRWPFVMDYYDQLVEAFRDGQLHVHHAPSAELLSKSDPYDLQYLNLTLGDATLYDGKYYMYWGPVPALLQAAAKEVLGIDRIIGDHYLLFAFVSLSFLCGTSLIVRAARRLFPSLSFTMVVAAVVGFGLANPAPYLLTWARVYEDAIMGGQAFALLGLAIAFEAVWRARWQAPGRGRLLLVGTAFALSIGCRASLGPALAIATLLTALITSTGHAGVIGTARFARFVRVCFWIGVPMALSVFGLLLYNRLRFDAWFDFGMDKQITIWPFRVSARYLLPNVASYLLRVPDLTCDFPFVLASFDNGSSLLSRWFPDPRGYVMPEQVVGLLIVVPIAWTAPVALGKAAIRIKSWLFDPNAETNLRERHQARSYVWLVGCLVAFATLPPLGPWAIRLATMRYLGDVTNSFVLLGTLGLWTAHEAWRGRLRASVRVVAVALAAVTAAFGLLLGYQGYSVDFFKNHNPELDARLKGALSFCPSQANIEPGRPNP